MVSIDWEHSPLYLAYKMVEEGKLDPWDVDLEKLLREYLQEIRRMELMDLRIPARVVAFATFLIKKQLEILFPKPPKPRTRRKVTLKELEEEFENTPIEEFTAQKVPKRVKRRKNTKGGMRKKELPPLEPPLHKARLEEVLEYLLELLEQLTPGQLVPFSRYATKNDYVAKFWSLLNLAASGKAELLQRGNEIFFGPPKGED